MTPFQRPGAGRNENRPEYRLRIGSWRVLFTEKLKILSVEEIKKRNYNLDIKNPHQAENNIGNPKKLLADYKKLLKEIAKTRNSLKKELMNALK